MLRHFLSFKHHSHLTHHNAPFMPLSSGHMNDSTYLVCDGLAEVALMIKRGNDTANTLALGGDTDWLDRCKYPHKELT